MITVSIKWYGIFAICFSFPVKVRLCCDLTTCLVWGKKPINLEKTALDYYSDVLWESESLICTTMGIRRPCCQTLCTVPPIFVHGQRGSDCAVFFFENLCCSTAPQSNDSPLANETLAISVRLRRSVSVLTLSASLFHSSVVFLSHQHEHNKYPLCS